MKKKQKNKNVKPWDFLNKNTEFTTKEVSEKRLSICRTCPKFISLTKQCKLCLCIMPAKTILADASCPLNKWKKTDIYFDLENNTYTPEENKKNNHE
jgi:hypothetical protein